MASSPNSDRIGTDRVRRRVASWPRLALRLGVVFGFAIVFAVSSYYGRRNERMLELVQTGHFPSVKTAAELTELLSQLQRGLLDAAQSADPDALQSVDETYATFLRTLDRSAENPVADRERLSELRTAVQQYYQLARQTTVRMIEGETFDAVAPALWQMKERQNAAEGLLRESSRRDDEAIRSAFVTSRNTQRTTMTVMGGVILACMAALLIGSLMSDRLHETRRRNELLQQNRADLEREVANRTAELTAAANENAELSRRNRMILDAAGEGIFGLNANGVVTFINPTGAAMLGFSVDEILGTRMHDITQCTSDFMTASETDFKKRNGSSVPVDYTASPILGADGVLTGMVVTFRDISARRAIEQMKDEFVSTVNHELRTPLTSLRGALGLLNSGMIGPIGDRGQRMLSIAVQNTDRLIRLINDILDLERIRSGKIELDQQTLAASDLMRTVIDGVQTLADQAKVDLFVEPTDAMVWADSDRIVQTLTNLVSNAIKFSPAGATVSVGVVPKSGGFEFHVADRGRGIPEDRLETVFERFQQVDASDSRDKGGSGLGLAICRSIVNAHGGRIWAERREGGGSVFRFTLPASPRLQSADAAQAEHAAHRTLLIGGQASAWGTQIQEMLETSGFQVVASPSVDDVVACAAKTRPDAIVLDVVSESGWRTVEALQSDADTRCIPLVVVGAQPPESMERYAASVAGWVANPLGRQELVDAVTEACATPAILVVEDDLDLARVMIASLQMHGIRALHASTGREAVALCRTHEPNLIVLDLILPDIDGFAVVEAVRNDPSLGNVPLVVYSASEVLKADQPRLKLGTTEFLTKSRTSLQEFQSHVIRLLNRVTSSRNRSDAA